MHHTLRAAWNSSSRPRTRPPVRTKRRRMPGGWRNSSPATCTMGRAWPSRSSTLRATPAKGRGRGESGGLSSPIQEPARRKSRKKKRSGPGMSGAEGQTLGRRSPHAPPLVPHDSSGISSLLVHCVPSPSDVALRRLPWTPSSSWTPSTPVRPVLPRDSRELVVEVRRALYAQVVILEVEPFVRRVSVLVRLAEAHQ